MLLVTLLLIGQTITSSESRTLTVTDDTSLRAAVREASPGLTIALSPGQYTGGLFATELHGTPDRPIRIVGADTSSPPVLVGGPSAIHLSIVSHLELADLVIEGATDNGLNIDDGGRLTEPSHHVTLRHLVVRDVGPIGNRDAIKLSGVDAFRIESCRIERWGDGGSGLDMVGCHQGEVVGCTFQNGGAKVGNGVQAKGGCTDIAVRRCTFENAGARAINLGGSTGLAFFRPKPQGFEARNLTVEDCRIVGSDAAIAFVGVDGAVVRHNTIENPTRWVFRILQETTQPGFVPCRNGVIELNRIQYQSHQLREAINVGSGTEPESFTLSRNAWQCLDKPSQGPPHLAVPEIQRLDGNAEPADAGVRPESVIDPHPAPKRVTPADDSAPTRAARSLPDAPGPFDTGGPDPALRQIVRNRAP
jgi:hypothetical protein